MEIERKFLLRENQQDYFSDAMRAIYPNSKELKRDVLNRGYKIMQGYLPLDSGILLARDLGATLDFNPTEARLRSKALQFFFTLKGDGGLSRCEVEQEITADIFSRYWNLTNGKRVVKVRFEKPYQKHTLELDVYVDNRDLVIAEVEFPSLSDAGAFPLLGKDVSEDSRYKNKNLAK